MPSNRTTRRSLSVLEPVLIFSKKLQNNQIAKVSNIIRRSRNKLKRSFVSDGLVSLTLANSDLQMIEWQRYVHYTSCGREC